MATRRAPSRDGLDDEGRGGLHDEGRDVDDESSSQQICRGRNVARGGSSNHEQTTRIGRGEEER
ncbi:hypothetical protein AHAS_Ahas07G0073200 [Arachis hypogaea]